MKGGCTLHGLFSLNKYSLDWKDLANTEPVESVKQRFQFIEFLGIDEYSLLSGSILAWLDIQLRKIKSRDIYFGGISIIISGELNQLPCVGGYSLTSNVDSVYDNFAKKGILLYQEKFNFFYISSNYRSSDIHLQKIIHNLRRKKIDSADIAALNSRLYKNVNKLELNLFNDAKAVFPFRSEARDFSNFRLQKMGLPILELRPKFTPKIEGLLNVFKEFESVFVCHGCKIILRQNISLEANIFSGVEATFFCPFYASETEDVHTPSCILVEIKDAKCKKINGNLIPIFPITESFDFKGKRVKVTGYNLRSSFGLTYYQSQGHQFEKLMLKLGNREIFPNSSYMLLGRVRRLQDLVLLDDNISINRFTDKSFMRMHDECQLEAKRFGIFEKIYSPLNVSM